VHSVGLPDAGSVEAHLDAALSPGAGSDSQERLSKPATVSHQTEHSRHLG